MRPDEHSGATPDSHRLRSGTLRVMCSTARILALALASKAMEPLSLGTSSTWQQLSRRAHSRHLARRGHSGDSASSMKPTSTPPLFARRRGGTSVSGILHRFQSPSLKLKMDVKIVVKSPPNKSTSRSTRRSRTTRNFTRLRRASKWSTYAATMVATTRPKDDKTASEPIHNVTYRNPTTFDTVLSSNARVKLFTASYLDPVFPIALRFFSPPASFVRFASHCYAAVWGHIISSLQRCFFLAASYPRIRRFRRCSLREPSAWTTLAQLSTMFQI